MYAGAKFGFVFVALVSAAATTGCGAAVETTGIADRAGEHAAIGYRPDSIASRDWDRAASAGERVHRAEVSHHAEPHLAKRCAAGRGAGDGGSADVPRVDRPFSRCVHRDPPDGRVPAGKEHSAAGTALAVPSRMDLRLLTSGMLLVACAGCVAPAGDAEDVGDLNAPLAYVAPVVARLPSGTLHAKVVEIASEAELPATLNANGMAYIHASHSGAWYFSTGHYLLGVESFVQYHQEWDKWVSFGSGGDVAPARARVLAQNPDGQGWAVSSLLEGGAWPQPIDGVWIVGTNSGVLAMVGAPERIPLGTVVVGSMQAYGGSLSTPWLLGDDSTHADSSRIRALVSFDASTQLGGHSAGSSAARRIALDLGLAHVFLYGTPNYTRGSGARTVDSQGMVAEVINNDQDPVTNCLADPWSLVSLAWGTAKCHSYEGWDYEKTSPRTVVCN